MDIYYESDQTVCEDSELQAFVKDVFIFGLRDNEACGNIILAFITVQHQFLKMYANLSEM